MSVVLPAHDEGPLVRRTLERLLADAEDGEFEIVVVANGCRDDTADQARAVAGVTVVEIAQASKIAALNAGDAAATAFPRAYVDCDVELSTAALRALADTLTSTPEPRAAAPRMVVDWTRSSLPVRCYYRVWAQSDYRGDGHIGSGVYAVNEAGRARWGEFPQLIADDRFVQQRFLPAERVTLADHSFTVTASSTMSAHVRRGARIERGNRELPAEVQVEVQDAASRRYARLLGRVAARPSLWTSLPFYVYGFGAAKLRARGSAGRPVAWDRDGSSRTAATA